MNSYKSAKRLYVFESTAMSLKAATAAATDINPKKQTFSQCHDFCRELILFPFATKYMWFAKMNVRGNTLIAPVRLSKSPKNGSIADIKVLIVR